MRSAVLTLVFCSVCLVFVGQTESRKATDSKNKTVTSNSKDTLSKDNSSGTHIYELPTESEYTVYDSKGKKVLNGTGKSINYSKLQAGTYFVKHSGGTFRLIKKEATTAGE